MFSVVGAGLGALIGLLADFVGAGHWVVVAGGLAGAAAPLLMGEPGR